MLVFPEDYDSFTLWSMTMKIANKKTYPKSKIINGWKVEAKVGYYVHPDGWRFGECLASSDWDDANYYLPTGYDFGIKQIATNIYISGGKMIHKDGAIYIRVQVEFVGDGDPNTYVYGVMKLLNMDYVGE